MAEVTGAQLAARQIKQAGIDTAFGIVAGPMIEVMSALEREGVRVVNCRHEESACFMASAWGFINKKPGVVVVGSGPAMTNTVSGLYVATESAMPLVVLGGSVQGAHRGLGGFQEANQVSYAMPAAKWTQSVDSTERIPELVHLALGKSVTGRPGGVYLDFPGHLVGRKIDEERAPLRATAPDVTRPFPDPAAVERVARMLADAQRPLVLVGKGAAWSDAGAALESLVNRGIPFVASPMGRGTIPDDNPMCVNAARSSALAGADAILMVGARFNWIFQFGQPPRFSADARIAHIDIEPEEMYSAANIETGIVADCAVAVDALNSVLDGATVRSAGGEWLTKLREDAAKNDAAIAEQMDSDQVPVNHYRLVRDVRDTIERDAITTADAELTMGVTRIVLTAYGPGNHLNSGTTGCMGTGLPYAIGAKLARPDKQVVAVLGDYAFGAAAMEVETAARVGAHVVIVISNNAGIAGHSIQDRMFAPDAPPIAAMLPVHYEKMAEMVGGYARRIERPDDFKPALQQALASNTVSVLNVLTDPKGSRRGSAYLG